MAKLINRTGSLWLLLICFLFFVATILSCIRPPAAPPPQRPEPPRKSAPPMIAETSREYLRHNQNEERGYGLYSYVLLRHWQNKNQFNRYVRLSESYHKSLYPSDEYLGSRFKKEEINVTYWPIAVEQESQISDAESSEDWEFFVKNYHYFRSKLMLDRIKELSLRPGPFIVAYNVPLGALRKDKLIVQRREMLVFDLSDINEDLFDKVLLLYQKKVAEGPETWKETFDIEEIRIRCRSILKEQADKIIYLATFLKGFIG